MVESLAREHQRLLADFRRLKAEHALVEKRKGDLPAHREHNTRLRAHIEALRRHMARLRSE